MGTINLESACGNATLDAAELVNPWNIPECKTIAVGIDQDIRNIPLRDYLEIISVINSYSQDVKLTFWD